MTIQEVKTKIITPLTKAQCIQLKGGTNESNNTASIIIIEDDFVM